MSAVTPQSRVVLVNASTSTIDWTGLLSEFFAANAETIDEAEQTLVLKILNGGGVYHFGGGAGPLQWLKAIDRFLSDPKPDPPDIVAEEAMEAEHYDKGKGLLGRVLTTCMEYAPYGGWQRLSFQIKVF